MTLMGRVKEDEVQRFEFLEPNNIADTDASISSNNINSMFELVHNFLMNRAATDDHYSSQIYGDYTNSTIFQGDTQFYEEISFIRFQALPLAYTQSNLALGQSSMCKKWMTSKLVATDNVSNDGLCVPRAILHHCHNDIGFKEKDKPIHQVYHYQSIEEIATAYSLRNGDGSIKKFWTLDDIKMINATSVKPPFNRITGKALNKSKKPCIIGIALIGGNGDLVHLPPKIQDSCIIPLLMNNGHVTNFTDIKIGRRIIQDQLELYKACIRFKYQQKGLDTPKSVYEDAWKLFIDTQHHQPNIKAVQTEISEILQCNIDFKSDIMRTYKKVKNTSIMEWKTKFELNRCNDMLAAWMLGEGADKYYAEKPGRAMYPNTFPKAIRGVVNINQRITKESCESILKANGVGEVITNLIKETAPWEVIKEHDSVHLECVDQFEKQSGNAMVIKMEGVKAKIAKYESETSEKFPIDPTIQSQILNDLSPEYGSVEFNMNDYVAFDIETASCHLNPGVFKTYAAQLKHASVSQTFIANTVGELIGNKCLTDMITRLLEIEAARPRVYKQAKKGKSEDVTPPLYVVAHNSSKFDAVDVLHTIFMQDGLELSGFLKSNGRFITFMLNNKIKFIDSFLFTMGSLKQVAVSLGLKSQKLSLPHKYLQGCSTYREIIHRLHGDVMWEELGPYMDWFEDTRMEDLQERVEGRSHDDWIKQQSTFKE